MKKKLAQSQVIKRYCSADIEINVENQANLLQFSKHLTEALFNIKSIAHRFVYTAVVGVCARVGQTLAHTILC